MKKRTRITAKMEQKMQELRAQGKSAKEIAAVVGVSETAVRTHTTGIVVPEDEKQARVEAVRKMYTEGKTYTQIAAETGASASTIRNYTCDLPRRDRNRNGAPIPREKVTKIRELRVQGKSFEAIARQMGIKPVKSIPRTYWRRNQSSRQQVSLDHSAGTRKPADIGVHSADWAGESAPATIPLTGTSCVPGPQISARALLAQRQGRIKTQWE